MRDRAFVRLDITKPVLQAPIGSTASPELLQQSATPAASVIWRALGAVANSSELGEVKASTRGPLGINFILELSFDARYREAQ